MGLLENLLQPSEYGWTLTKGNVANLLSIPYYILPGPTSETAVETPLPEVPSPPTSTKLSRGSKLQEPVLDSGPQRSSGSLNFHPMLTQEIATACAHSEPILVQPDPNISAIDPHI